MSGLEVEYTSGAAKEGASAAEYVAVLIPTLEDVCVGLRNLERLCIKLLLGKLEVLRDSCGNGVRGHDVPDNLLLVVTPKKVTCCTYDCTEGL